MYQWHFHGLREDVQLRAMGVGDLADAQGNAMAGTGAPHPNFRRTIDQPITCSTVWNPGTMRSGRVGSEEHRERIQLACQLSTREPKVSHAARMTILKEQLSRATDEKIRRMRQSQILSAEADYNRRTMELDHAVMQADITSTLVAQGVLRIKRLR